MSLQDALETPDAHEAEEKLVEWIFADRELDECRELVDKRILTPDQAHQLYHWLHLIELGIARRGSTGRRWLDENSAFRLTLGGMRLAIARQFPDVPMRLFARPDATPEPLAADKVLKLIQDHEQQVVEQRRQAAEL